MINENDFRMHKPKVLSTIASQKTGIIELVKALDQHQHIVQAPVNKLNAMMAKVVQLIIANHLNKLDHQNMENKLALAIKEPHFNIFNFAKQFADH
jgi:putative protein kinase ArgK-like GTPase of G3E family